MYLKTPYKLIYDTKKFPFNEIVSKMLEVKDLAKVHELKDYPLLSREQDQSTIWHRAYYDKFMDEFYDTYTEFVKHLAGRLDYNEIIYQKIPTFRVHLVGNLGVGEWHRDRDYNHDSNELNFWMPFVNTYDTNTLWMESKEGDEDFMPYNVNYGEILVFNGADLFHGNKTNDTEDCRVSVDFRLVDPAKFNPSDKGSINMKTKFDLGGYFEKITTNK